MKNILLKISRTCNGQFKCNYLKNEKPFHNILFHFCNLHQTLNVLEEKMVVIGNVLPKLETAKNLDRTLSEKPHYRTQFDSQNMKASQMLWNSTWECFYDVFLSLSWKLIWKMSPLVLGEILGVFVNTFTAHEKYRVQDCENLQLPIQMILSEKRKTFSEFFVPFPESTSNFKHFEKKDDCHS